MSALYEYAVAVGQFRTFLKTTPPEWTPVAVRDVVDAVLDTGCRAGLSDRQVAIIARHMIGQLRPDDVRLRAAVEAELRPDGAGTA